MAKKKRLSVKDPVNPPIDPSTLPQADYPIYQELRYLDFLLLPLFQGTNVQRKALIRDALKDDKYKVAKIGPARTTGDWESMCVRTQVILEYPGYSEVQDIYFYCNENKGKKK